MSCFKQSRIISPTTCICGRKQKTNKQTLFITNYYLSTILTNHNNNIAMVTRTTSSKNTLHSLANPFCESDCFGYVYW